MVAKRTLETGLAILRVVAASDTFKHARSRLRDRAATVADSERMPRVLAGAAGILAALLTPDDEPVPPDPCDSVHGSNAAPSIPVPPASPTAPVLPVPDESDRASDRAKAPEAHRNVGTTVVSGLDIQGETIPVAPPERIAEAPAPCSEATPLDAPIDPAPAPTQEPAPNAPIDPLPYALVEEPVVAAVFEPASPPVHDTEPTREPPHGLESLNEEPRPEPSAALPIAKPSRPPVGKPGGPAVVPQRNEGRTRSRFDPGDLPPTEKSPAVGQASSSTGPKSRGSASKATGKAPNSSAGRASGTGTRRSGTTKKKS